MLESKQAAIESLESAMQLASKIPCECSKPGGKGGCCLGKCDGSRIWSFIHQAWKFFRREHLTVLEWIDAEDAERLSEEGRLGKDIYCVPLFRDSLTNSFTGDAYIGTSLVVFNRGAWRNIYTHEEIEGISHFAILPIFPLRTQEAIKGGASAPCDASTPTDAQPTS